jgi:hypothetical protein
LIHLVFQKLINNIILDRIWFEEASSPGCVNCLLHDLDLTVTYGGVTYYANCPPGSSNCQPDRRNNAERIIINGVQNLDVATITVTAHNLARYEQNYSLVATGCFGGVANQLYANGECSVFECDNSKSKRTAIILSVILVPIGVIVFGFVSKKMIEKKREREYYAENPKRVDEHTHSRGHIEEGTSVMDENNKLGHNSHCSQKDNGGDFHERHDRGDKAQDHHHHHHSGHVQE